MGLDLAAGGIQTLDLARFEGRDGERTAFLGDLRRAARETGFFHLVGHGVPAAITGELFHLARRFFALPDAEKRAIEMVNSPHFRGYNRPGAELTRGRPDWREQLDIGAERSPLPWGPSSPPWMRLQGPNQWPAALPELRDVALDWQARTTALAIRLLRAFALALGQAEDAFAPIHANGPTQLVKLIRYPGRLRDADDQGVGAHKDSGFLTILAQDRVGGLQVETADGWIDVPPLEGAFVVNIGEALELASNGYLRATVHRVVAPPAGRDRLSAALFFGAALDSVVPALDLPPDLAAEAMGPTADPANPLFRDQGRNYLKGRLRSHPDVAERWHADLLAAGWA